MTQHVYLAGPIAGKTKGEANDWRIEVADYLDDLGIQTVSPLRCEPLTGERYELGYSDPRFGTAGAISGKNWFDTSNCDMGLAYLPRALTQDRPSYGTIMELGWAIGLRKPIILVSDDESLVNHPLIQYNVPWVLPDLEAACEVVTGILEVYV